jgi:aspartyl-tRNA(Asn)/glutamyl-tRNA(Gln) amidotransferase subunit C
VKISREEVLHVAKLAHLELGEGEIEKYTGQLDAILGYMDKLRSVDTGGVEPTYHALKNLSNVSREDVTGHVLPLDKALANAPERQKSFFKVPRIVEEQE